jgi:hypothetical protein
MSRSRRQWQQGQTTYQSFQEFRNQYFSAIKYAKAKCWNEFLENAEGKEVFKAFQYTKLRTVQKLPILEYEMHSEVLQNNLPTSVPTPQRGPQSPQGRIPTHSRIKAITFKEKCKAFMHVLFKAPPASDPISWLDFREKQWELLRTPMFGN